MSSGAAPGAAGAPGPGSADALLRVGRLISGYDEPPLRDAVVAVRDGRIAAVGSAADFGSRLEREPVLGDAGITALPGLIDCHAHPTLPTDRRPILEDLADGPEMAVLMAVAQLGRHLRAGYTVVRDCGAPGETGFALRTAVERELFPSPRLLIAGQPISQPGGHLSMFGSPAGSVDEIRVRVRALAARAVDVVKVVASGGSTGGDPGRASYPVGHLRAAVEEAHAHGLTVVAHCRATDAIRSCAEAGVDVIAHLEFLGHGPMEALGGGAPTSVPAFDRAVAEAVAEAGSLLDLDPHSSGWDTVVALRGLARERPLGDEERSALAGLERYFEGMLGVITGLRELGLVPRMAFGSDAGPWDTEFGHPEYELELARLAGLSPLESIQVVTRNAARVCAIADRAGTLEAGRDADLLLVRGDPLEEVGALARVQAVYRRGRAVHGSLPPATPSAEEP